MNIFLKKVLVTSLFFIIGLPLYASTNRGVVIVLEAPIQVKPRLNAKVIQYARKGQKLYVHPQHFMKGQLAELIVDPKETFSNYEQDQTLISYYQTITRNGQKAYIQKKHVKLIFNDERELTQTISPYHRDPTDYRLEEPLDDNYPFVRPEAYRSGLLLTLGPNITTNYRYSAAIGNQEVSTEKGFQFFYVRKANWDKRSRFFFGATSHLSFSQSKFNLINGQSSQENSYQLGVGPTILYDIWRSKDYALSTGTSLLVNYNRQTITQDSITENDVNGRAFTGFTIAPNAYSYFSFKDIVKNIDLVAGLSVQAFLPHKLSASATQDQSNLWEDDTIVVPFNAHWSLSIGIQGRY